MSVGSAYAYFDKEGNLKEFISDSSVRRGNVSINDIYIYVDELEFNPQNITVSYKVSSRFYSKHWKIFCDYSFI